MKVLLIIPAYNEAENIETVVENIKENYSCYDYIIVNDGSKDKTADICREKGYAFVDLPVNLGLASCFQTGIKYAKKMGYDVAVQLDGDGQHDPVYIKSMLMELDNNDIVIGSRYVSKKKPLTSRMIGSRLITLAIFLTTGKKINDPTSGMRMFNKKMIDIFADNINYGPEPDTISYLIKRGARIAEVQVEMKMRVAGTSYLNLTRSLRYMLNILISIFFVQLFRE